MEENVALESSKQRKFIKSIKGIKKLIKKNEKVGEKIEKKPEDQVAKKGKRKRPDRGLVYLSHIPHGFYENEMTQYFKQFGVVTNVRVIRSKHTGNSKGHAFVEFKEPAVGEIVAETMNNYLMGKRLIKAAYIPPEKQRRAMRKRWSRTHNPGREARLKCKKAYNENKDDKGELKRARKIVSNLNKTKTKLTEMGINYDFFTPVDVPEPLSSLIQTKQTQDKKQKDEKQTNKKLKENKTQNVTEVKEEKSKKVNKSEPKDLGKKETKKELTKKEVGKKESSKKETTKKNKVPIVDKKEQKEKQQKLKDAGVKPMGDFVKITQESDDDDSDSGSEDGFDSDAYERMMQKMSEDSELSELSDDEDDDDDDDDDDDEDDDDEEDEEGSEEGDSDESESEEEEEIVPPPKKVRGRKGPIAPPPIRVQENKKGKPAPQKEQNVKRKVPQKPVNVAKKPSFEKQKQQPLKKQFKKKK